MQENANTMRDNNPPVLLKKYRLEEYIVKFSGETQKSLIKELQDEMGIKSRMLHIYRSATTEDSTSIGVDKLAAAAQVFSHYLGVTITINDLITH